MQKAKIDVWGVGTKLITACTSRLWAVYKIVAIEDETADAHTIKLFNNAEKCRRQVSSRCGGHQSKRGQR